MFGTFLNTQKSIFSNPIANANGTTAKIRSKVAQNNLNPPSKVNIEQPTAICLKQNFPKLVKNLENRQLLGNWT